MTEEPERSIRKFNPGTFQSDKEVKEQFVVRKYELHVLLDILRGNIESPSCQHALIVAPRGRGKTMLLARAAAEIRTNPELARHLLPVIFMEESQEIFNLTDFWLETLFHLARECATRDSQLADELHSRHAALSERWREQSLEDNARAAVLDAADRLGRKLVLVVENLQALCKDVDQDFGWKLREVLQTEPQIILLASATSRFAELDDAEQPFFETFRIVNLKPLTTEECRRLWKVVSGDKVTGREIRPLEILTGGSPRLIVIVAGFGRHRSLRHLMEELVMLIDDHTEYFRGHLDILGKTERRVYIAVLDLWRQSTPGEIATRARMDVRVVSTMLGRLFDRGALVIEGSGRKREYSAAEPLYCIYYKLRRGRGDVAIVENLIRFMSVFYSEAEREEIFAALISDGMKSSVLRYGFERAATVMPEFARFIPDMLIPCDTKFRSVVPKLDSGVPNGVAERLAATVPDYDSIERLVTDISTALDQEDFETVIDIVDRASVMKSPAHHRVSRMFAAWALNMKGEALRKIGRLDAATSTHEEVVSRFGAMEDAQVRKMVAMALASKGRIQEQKGNPNSALLSYKEVAECFGGSADPGDQGWVARALIRNGDILREIADPESALSAYEEVVQRFGASGDLEVRRWVAEALTRKAEFQTELSDTASAVSTYEVIIQRFGASDSPELAGHAATALNRKGVALLERSDAKSAVKAFDEFLDRFGSAEDPHLLEWIARTLIAKGCALREMGQVDLAVSTCRQAVERFGSSEDADVLWWVGGALVHIAHANWMSGKFDEAIATCDETVKRFGSREQPELRRWAAMAAIDKAEILIEVGRTQDALHTCDEFESSLRDLDDGIEHNLTWRSRQVWIRALMAQPDIPAAMTMFRSLFDMLVPDDDTMMRDASELTFKMIAAGASTRELLDVLSNDDAKATALTPLVVALRQHAGEIVREPREILQVAADIRNRIQEEFQCDHPTFTMNDTSDGPHSSPHGNPSPNRTSS